MLPEASQTEFRKAVLDPGAAVPVGIARANGADPVEAFNVYRNNVVVGLVEALKAAFPVTAQLMGDGLTDAIMADFARANPPKSPILSSYGKSFPVYLRDHPATVKQPFFAEMALLERAKLDSYHAADAAVMAADALTKISPDALAEGLIPLHPAVRILRCRFPVASMYHVEKRGMDGTLEDGARASIDIRKSEAVLVTRPLYDVMITAISQGSAAFLEACGDGKCFADAAEAGFAAEAEFDLQSALGAGLQFGAFAPFVPKLNS
ncbi:MAG: DNA-binding domain-containing protein [Pseudomonadota bacterium]